MSPHDKSLAWLAGEVRTPPFSQQARLEAGFLLRRLQKGEKIGLPHSRPMPSIGRRCHELRVVDEQQTWRIVYALEPEAIVILDVFSKKTRTTPPRVIANCRDRIAAFRELSED